MKATKQIDIYLTKKRNVRLIDVVQYDTGIRLVFIVKDFTIPSGATATLYVQKPSGKFVYQETGITVSGNTVTINLHNQAITEYGKVPYQVSITSGSDVITTFTGLMMVEKSLKDAGATESKTVIRAFDEAVSDHVAEFQAKAEQIVQACIATIPDDYTEMEAKVNELANAVKGYLSGAIVFADDVSPMEHNPSVKVRSKNLFLCMAAGKTATMAGVTFTYNNDGSVKLQGTATGSANFVVGEVYLDDGTYYLCDFATGDFPDNLQARIQIYSDSTGKSIATLNNFASATVGGGDSFLPAGWYQCRIRIDAGHTYDCTLYPTLFKAEQPTEYIQNVADLTVATVRCHGKNLFKVTPNTINGVTISKKNDYFVLNGTATASNNFVVSIGHLPAGKYTLSANNPSNNGVDWSLIDVYSSNPYSIIAVKDNSNNGKATAQLAESEYLCRIRIESGVVYNNFIIKPQLEVGDTATDYEAYTEPKIYIPAADGKFYGVTSISPNMTILTNTEGVIVECEYNRDTNKVVDELDFAPATAKVGQTIRVTEVDESGKPTKWEAVDFQERTHWIDANGTVHKLDNKYIDAEWMATKTLKGGNNIVIPEQTVSGSMWKNLQMDIQAGIIYDVYINGKLYSCEASANIIGNNTSLTLNDYPFCIYCAGNGATSGMFFHDNTISSPVTLKVTDHAEMVCNKIPVEYLPDELQALLAKQT